MKLVTKSTHVPPTFHASGEVHDRGNLIHIAAQGQAPLVPKVATVTRMFEQFKTMTDAIVVPKEFYAHTLTTFFDFDTPISASERSALRLVVVQNFVIKEEGSDTVFTILHDRVTQRLVVTALGHGVGDLFKSRIELADPQELIAVLKLKIQAMLGKEIETISCDVGTLQTAVLPNSFSPPTPTPIASTHDFLIEYITLEDYRRFNVIQELYRQFTMISSVRTTVGDRTQIARASAWKLDTLVLVVVPIPLHVEYVLRFYTTNNSVLLGSTLRVEHEDIDLVGNEVVTFEYDKSYQDIPVLDTLIRQRILPSPIQILADTAEFSIADYL